VCAHDDRSELEAAIAAGESMRALAASYGLSARALARHLDAGHGPGRPIPPRRVIRVGRQKADNAAVVRTVELSKEPDDPAGDELVADNAAVVRPTKPPKESPDPAGDELEAAVAAPERLVEPFGTDHPTEAPRGPQTEIDAPTGPPPVGLGRLLPADAPPSLDLSDPATQRAVLAALAGQRDEAWLEAEAEYLRELRGEPGPAWQRRPF
jgi:hypothetical protein